MMQKVIESPQVRRKLAELRQEILILEKLNKFLEMKVQKMTQVDEAPPSWIKIENRETILAIVTSFADSDKKQILEMLKEKPLTVLEIAQRTNLSQTSTYRKVNELIKDNMIKSAGLVLNKEGKRVNVYSATIKHMRIYFEENAILMFLMLEDNQENF
jgi:predicted transcriptional regulator